VHVVLLTRSTRQDLISRGTCINPALPQFL